MEKQNIRAVILIGPLDFGRCKLASSLSVAMWPMLDKPVIYGLVEQLVSSGIKNITICSKDYIENLGKILDGIEGLNLNIIIDELPEGTAGSFRNAAAKDKNELFVVLPASIIALPDIDKMIECHNEKCSDLTIAFNPSENNDAELGRCAEIYLCNSRVINYIPAEGYCDIKETLIPRLVRDNRKVSPYTLDGDVGGFRNVPDYLSAVSLYLSSGLAEKKYPQLKKSPNYGNNVFIGENVRIDDSVKIYGPAVIFDNVVIEKNTVLVGPVVIGAESDIGPDCIISDSFLWKGSGVSARSKLDRCILSYNTHVLSDTARNSTCITPKAVPAIDMDDCGKTPLCAIISLVAVIAALFWSYWSTFVELTQIWRRSDEYSAGILVPFLAGYVIWSRRDELKHYSIRPAFAGIFALFAVGIIRMFGLYLNYGSVERISFVLTIFSVVLLVLGWRLFFKLFPVLMFLFLMLPLPNRVNDTFSLGLQEWATGSAVWLLEMLGYIAKREGNIIHLGDTTVAVAEACNGLRMITSFFIIAGWFALLVNRKWWEKIFIFASALPISLLCNTIRLAITSIAFTMLDARTWGAVFHDYGGYAMMPLAIAFIIGELWIFGNLFVVDKHQVQPDTVENNVIEKRRQ